MFRSKVLAFDHHQLEDPIDQELERHFKFLQNYTEGQTDVDVGSVLQSLAQDMHKHQQIMDGLVYGILTTSGNQQAGYFNQMSLCVRDNFETTLGRVQYFSEAAFSKLQDEPKSNLFWLVRNLMHVKSTKLDHIILGLLRNMIGGDLSKHNIETISNILEMLETNAVWLEARPKILATAVFLFLRNLADHAAVEELKTREASFCVRYLRTKFVYCREIGRDLLRALWEASNVPEVAELFQQISQNEMSAIPDFQGLEELLKRSTPRSFIQMRIPFDMQENLQFMMEKVIWGTHDEVFFEWFKNLYLNSRELFTHVGDIIRYIVVCFHPTNEQLQSKVVPRYALIGKITRALPGKVLPAAVKMAVLLDLLCYQCHTDSIMNIEPAILLMDRSADKYPQVVNWVVEFLFSMVHSFNPLLSDFFQNNMVKAFQAAISKHVIKNLDRIYRGKKVETKTKEIFYDLVYERVTESNITVDTTPTAGEVRTHEEAFGEASPVTPNLSRRESSIDEAEVSEELWMFGDTVQEFILACSQGNAPAVSELMTKIVSVVRKVHVPMQILAASVGPSFQTFLDVSGPDGTSIVNDVFRQLFAASESDPQAFDILLSFLRAMAQVASQLGWQFLSFVSRHENLESSCRIYGQYEEPMTPYGFGQDLKALAENDVEAFFEMIPVWLKHMPKGLAVNNMELVHQICASLDPSELYKMTWKIGTQQIELMTRSPSAEELRSTLEWDSFEQQNFWTVFRSSFTVYDKTRFDSLTTNLLPFLGSLTQENQSSIYSSFPEAAAGVIDFCKQVHQLAKSTDLVSCLMGENIDNNALPISIPIFMYWTSLAETKKDIAHSLNALKMSGALSDSQIRHLEHLPTLIPYLKAHI